MKKLILMIFLSIPLILTAEENSVQEAMSLLLKTNRMESQKIEEGAVVSETFLAFDRLAKDKNSKNYFLRLIKDGTTPEAKAYGLIGIYTWHKSEFNYNKNEINKFKNVKIIIGSIIHNLSISDLINDKSYLEALGATERSTR